MKYLLFANSLALFATAHSSHKPEKKVVSYCKSDGPDCAAIPEDVMIDFKLVDGDSVQIDVVTKNKTWVGVILGSNMMAFGSDMVGFAANGMDSECRDMHSDPGAVYYNVMPNTDLN